MPTSNQEPPLVTVTNPVTYLRRWWERVMGKEGIDFRFTIHPVTAVLMVAVIATIGFGAGRISLPDGVKIPFFEFGNVPTAKPTSTPLVEWKETAFTGKLQYSSATKKYFLVTTSSEAITLDVPSNLDLTSLIGKRIMAVGEYHKATKLLRVFDVKDLEVLPNTPVPIPTIEPTSTPSATPNISDIINTE
ncbi:MAG: hypothetical protein QY322_03920 [bacterium]|nr:MAG: hypothetical protein QY322_03920 [bacterium]